MKVVRVRLDAGSVERVLTEGYAARGSYVVVDGLPPGAMLSEAAVHERALVLYFTMDGEGLEERHPRLERA